jgi:hypothetical protein
MRPEAEEWEEEAAEEERSMTVPRPNNWASNVLHFFKKHWRPHPLEPPSVDPELPKLSAVERCAEVIRYTVQTLEHWLASSGWLREWVRLNIRIAVMIGTPTLLIGPLVTLALREFGGWATMIATASTNILYFPLTALLFIGLIAVLVMLTNTLRRRDPREMHRYY